MSFVRRDIPIILVFVTCMLQVVEYFIVNPALQTVGAEIRVWGTILASFTMALGAYGLLGGQYREIKRRTPGRWMHSLWFIILFCIMTVTGLYSLDHPVYIWLYDSVLSNLWRVMLSTTAFFIIYAAYRSFRARSVEASILLITGIFTCFKNIPVLRFRWEGFYSIGDWLFRVPTAGATRGLAIGAGIGVMVITLRVILGYERAYLGMPKEEKET